MHDVVLIVGLMFLAMVITAPLAVWLAVRNYSLASLFMAAAALMFGIHWFINISTAVRFIGLIAAILGVFAVWYSMRLARW